MRVRPLCGYSQQSLDVPAIPEGDPPPTDSVHGILPAFLQHVLGWYQAWGRTGEVSSYVIERQTNKLVALPMLMREYPLFAQKPYLGIMDIHDAPCFENLPCLWQMMRDSLQFIGGMRRRAVFLGAIEVDSSLRKSGHASMLHAIFMQALPYFHQNTKVWVLDDTFPVIVNVVMALMLGLYPNTTRKPYFHVRAAVFESLHALHTSSDVIKQLFLNLQSNLIILAFMEYITHVTPLFWPVEYNKLCEDPNMAAYFDKIPMACDEFRVVDVAELDWTQIDAQAAARIKKCSRSRRQGHASEAQIQTKNTVEIDVRRLTQCPVVPCYTWDTSGVNRRPVFTSAAEILREYHLVGHAFAVPSETLAEVHGLVKVYPLPENVLMRQRTAMSARYSDLYVRYICSRLFVCMHCLFHRSYLHSKFRLNIKTEEIICSECLNPTVLSVDMYGRSVIINHQAYVLCPCCCKVHAYDMTENVNALGGWLDFCCDDHFACVKNHYHGIPGKNIKRTLYSMQTSRSKRGQKRRKGQPEMYRVPVDKRAETRKCEVCGESGSTLKEHERVNHLTGYIEAYVFCHKHQPSDHDVKLCTNIRQLRSLRIWRSKWMSRGTAGQSRLVYDV